MTNSWLVVRLLVATALGTTAFAGCSSASPELRSNVGSDAAPTVTIRGAWRVVQLAVREPGREWEIRPEPQSGLYVFSARHYSYAYVPGGRARPHFSDANRPTEAEKAAAYDTFRGGAGSYSFDGAVLRMKSDVQKNPNEMTGELWKWQVELRGDSLRLLFDNPPFLPGRQWRMTLVRLE